MFAILYERQTMRFIFTIALNEDLEFLKLDSALKINPGPLEARSAMVDWIGNLFLSFATTLKIIKGEI
jgi:hypothetical protein